jgi:hypothetical protein
MRLVLPLLFACVHLYADQVVLKNGDRVTGKIVKKDGGTLSIKSDLLGDLTVKWENVASVESDQPLTVVVGEGETARGKVVTTAGQVEVADPAGAKQVPLDKVSAVRDAAEQAKYERYLHPPITDLWAGFFDIGLATAQGNARTLVFTTTANAVRATTNDSTTLHFNQIYSRGLLTEATGEQKVVETAKAIRGGWAFNRNISPRLFVNVFNDYEYDAFQNLDLRVTGGGGLGWKAWKSDRGHLDVVGGGNYDRDKFAVPLQPTIDGASAQFSRQSGELFWGDDLAIKFGPRSAVTQAFRMFDNVSTTGEYRMNFDLGTDTKLNHWLSWQITASDRYLTNPVPGKKTNDLLLSSGFRITFAR